MCCDSLTKGGLVQEKKVEHFLVSQVFLFCPKNIVTPKKRSSFLIYMQNLYFRLKTVVDLRKKVITFIQVRDPYIRSKVKVETGGPTLIVLLWRNAAILCVRGKGHFLTLFIRGQVGPLRSLHIKSIPAHGLQHRIVLLHIVDINSKYFFYM